MAPKKREAEGVELATDAKRAKVDALRPWQAVESVHIRDYGSPQSERIAAFDMDSTLISTKSGKTFPTSKDDWVLWAPEVVTKLRELHEKGNKIVIITNQAGVSKGKTSLGDITFKIDSLQAKLGVPLLAMILTVPDLYRKPLPNSWPLMEERFNGGVKAKAKLSFYCGDAAGRKPPVVKKKDFSDNDLKFALNVGLPFLTPEELFLGREQKYEKEHFEFDPRKIGVKPVKLPVPLPLKGQTLILTVGAPASGKSALATSHFQECTRVNQDILKKKEACHKACGEALKAGKSVIVDNQNKTKADRAPYLALAKSVGAKAIAIRCDVPKEFCFHLNSYRMLHTSSALHRPEKVPSMVIHTFFKAGTGAKAGGLANVDEPSEKEGFEHVYRLGLEHFKLTDDANVTLMRSFID